ncbi:MAG: CHAT domain-containing protein [Gammaproteobacteria bacterium]|nr:CHAT domain-containing protein [Gammaproteobacteria bacterium]
MNARTKAHALFAWLTCLFLGSVNAADETALELEVTSAGQHFMAEKAGIEQGDRLIAWSRVADDAPEPRLNYFNGPFDIYELEREQHLVDPIVLHGTRAGEPVTFLPRDGRWRLGVAPVWSDDAMVSVNAFKAAIEDGSIDDGIATATALANRLATDGRALDSAWVRYQTAALLGRKAEWTASVDMFRQAIEQLPIDEQMQQRNKTARALLLYYQSGALLQQDRLDEAKASYEEALALEESISPDRFGIAANLTGLSDIPRVRGDLIAAARLLEKAIRQLQRIAPESMIVAATVSKLGFIAVQSGSLEEAESHFQHSLRIYTEKDPNGVAASSNINNHGIISYMRGDLAMAAVMFERARQAKLRLEPGSKGLATAIHNVGLVNAERGNYRAAESYYLEALDLLEELVPGSLETTQTLNNLGSVALDQGDLAKAEHYHGRAYELRRELVPNSPDIVASLTNLGSVARYRGDYETANDHLLEALAIQQRIAVGSKQHARILQGLGAVAGSRDDIPGSTDYFRQALELYKEIAASGPGVAESHARLGFNNLKRKDFVAAASELNQAAEILSQIAPATHREARVLHGLAQVSRHQGDMKAAEDIFEKALRALDSQHARLGGTQESKAESRARHRSIYQDYIDFLLEIGDEERAFEILERSRSKVLSDLLVERDLVFNNDLPAELERERRMLAVAYEKTQANLLNASGAEKIAALRTELEEGRRKQDDVRRRAREHSAAFVDLQENRPLSLQEIRATLAPGTVVLSYNVGETDTRIFALSPSGELGVKNLNLGRDEIGSKVQRFRYLIDAGRWDETPATPLNELAEELYADLMAPFDEFAAAATRILIVPDGALNLLPFAALRREAASGDTQYVVEWKPLFVTNSLSVQAQLRANGKIAQSKTLVAFGGADYTNARARPTSSATVRGGAESTEPLPDLPWSAAEVNNIPFAERDRATIFLGQEATEENAKSLPRSTSYLHFAAHTVIDERSPLDTAIVLTVPDTESQTENAENGYLQAWEIYESVRTDAELVTLSGCETALGSAYPGEGLMGLTRAFQYAGASSVVASLWNVNDRSSSRLMTEFYGYLEAGESKEAALQLAQLAMVNSGNEKGWWQGLLDRLFESDSKPADAHPYHWAAFVLNGRGG